MTDEVVVSDGRGSDGADIVEFMRDAAPSVVQATEADDSFHAPASPHPFWTGSTCGTAGKV